MICVITKILLSSGEWREQSEAKDIHIPVGATNWVSQPHDIFGNALV